MPQNKILVEIYGENLRLISRKKHQIEQNHVIIEKAGVGRGKKGYAPEFERDSIITCTKGIWPFKRSYQKLMLFDGADKCLVFEDKAVKMAQWDKKTEKKLFDAHVIKSAGATTQKVQVPLMLYILVGLGLVFGVINLLMSTGRVRIG